MTVLTAGQLQSLHVQIRHVPASAPLKWLDQAWEDLRHIGAPGLAHGALIAILGAVLLMLGSSHIYFIAAAVSGYLLVGPVMTTGLCELARRRAAREPLSFDDSLQGMTRNLDGLMHFGAVLALVAIVWFALAALLLQTALSAAPPSLAVALWGGSADLDGGAVVGFHRLRSGAGRSRVHRVGGRGATHHRPPRACHGRRSHQHAGDAR